MYLACSLVHKMAVVDLAEMAVALGIGARMARMARQQEKSLRPKWGALPQLNQLHTSFHVT
jgi:hypothetical protein